MSKSGCHAQATSPRVEAKRLIQELGIGHVADWCGLSEAAIYKWFERATDLEPVPTRHVPKIVAGAQRVGKAVDVRVLCPGWPAVA